MYNALLAYEPFGNEDKAVNWCGKTRLLKVQGTPATS